MRLFSPGWYNWAILNKYFVDEAYNFWFVKLGKKFANWLWVTFDERGVNGIVNGVGALTAWSGQRHPAGAKRLCPLLRLLHGGRHSGHSRFLRRSGHWTDAQVNYYE